MYLIERTHIRPYIAECDTADLTRANAIQACKDDPDSIRRILHLDIAAGTSRDATKEIAQAVVDALDELPVAHELQNFLEGVLGCGVVARLVREMEDA